MTEHTTPTPIATATARADGRMIIQRGDTLRKLKTLNAVIKQLDEYNILCVTTWVKSSEV